MADVEHLQELFAPLGGVSFKRMFSGYGIMKDGMMFALISQDELYFKTDEVLASRFRAEGSRPWTPRMRGKVMTMPYWLVPERLFDEPDEFANWAREAFVVAKRLKVAKKAPASTKAKRPTAAKSVPATKRKPKAKAAPKRR